MDAGVEGVDPRRNRLLAALPGQVLEQVIAHCTPVQLGLREMLFRPNEQIEQVYLPLTCVVSLVVVMHDDASIEVATVGNEGIAGLPVFLGAHSLPMQAFNQVPGTALRMSAAAFREQLREQDGPLQTVLQRYTQTIFTQLAQNVACNRLHSVEQRCARWMLMTADRVDGNDFPLTHEFLAQMLGVRRASVSEVAGRLARTGAISYHRGVMTVVDRARLEAASCECYVAIRDVLDRMLGDPEAATDTEPAGAAPSGR